MTLGELKEQIDQILAQRPAAAMSLVFLAVDVDFGFDSSEPEFQRCTSLACEAHEPTPLSFEIRGQEA